MPKNVGLSEQNKWYIVATMASRMVSSQTADFSTEWILKTKLKSKEVQEMLLY